MLSRRRELQCSSPAPHSNVLGGNANSIGADVDVDVDYSYASRRRNALFMTPSYDGLRVLARAVTRDINAKLLCVYLGVCLRV